MGRGLGLALCAMAMVVLAACSADDAASSGWQADGGAARAHALGAAVSTTVNSVEHVAILDDSTDVLQTPVMLSANVVVATMADGRLLRVENGAVRWTHRAPQGARFASRPAIDAEGTIYAVDTRGGLVCVDASGVVRWRAALRKDARVGTVGDVLHTADLVVVAETAGAIAAFDPASGRRVWSVDRGALRTSVICGDAQRVAAVVAGMPDTLMQITRAGAVTTTPLASTEVTAGPMLVRDDVVIAGRTLDTRDGAFGIVHAVDATGSISWTTAIGTVPRFVSASGDTTFVVAVEPGGVGAAATRIIAIGDAGRRLWGVWYDKSITSPLIVGTDALICTVTEDAGLRWHDVMVIWRDGRIRRLIPFGGVPRALPSPVASLDGTVILATADGCGLLRCTERLMYNMLPQ